MKTKRKNPSYASLPNSEQTRDTVSNREPPIHAIYSFTSTPFVPSYKKRPISFSSHLKTLFIKNLLPNPLNIMERRPRTSRPVHDSYHSNNFLSSSRFQKPFAIPTSEELNKKLVRMQSARGDSSPKVEKNRKAIVSSHIEPNKTNITSMPLSKDAKKIINVSYLQITSGLASPRTQKSYDKSQKSLSGFESTSNASKKRKTSILKQRKNTIFRKVQNKTSEDTEDHSAKINFRLVQGNLAKEENLDFLKEHVKKASELCLEAQRVNEKFEKILQTEEKEETMRLKSTDQNDFIRVSNFSLTDYEITLLSKEFQKPSESRSLDLLDSITKRLKFFMKFNKLTRVKLLKHAHLKCYSYGLNLFNEGDEGENMYIIIRGAVNVFKKVKDHRTNKTSELLVSSLYDGDHFGELAMIGKGKQKHINTLEILETIKCFDDIVRQQNEEEQLRKLDLKRDIIRKIDELEAFRNEGKILNDEEEHFLETHDQNERARILQEIDQEQMNMGITKSKRMASVKIAETSWILSLSGENYRNILFNVIKSDLDYKIRILMHLPFFQKYEPYGLIPIANYLNAITFKLGELIISEGQEIDALYIVCKGRCKIVRIINPKETRDAFSEQYSKFLKEFNYLKKIKVESTEVTPKRIQKQDPKKLPINCELIEYRNIGKGEQFGGRSLIGSRTKHLFEARNSFVQMDNIKTDTARLSIVADSKEVELLKFSAQHIILIPDYLKKNFINGLSEFKEFDDYDVEKDTQTRLIWNGFKYTVENDIIAKNILLKSNYKPF